MTTTRMRERQSGQRGGRFRAHCVAHLVRVRVRIRVRVRDRDRARDRVRVVRLGCSRCGPSLTRSRAPYLSTGMKS